MTGRGRHARSPRRVPARHAAPQRAARTGRHAAHRPAGGTGCTLLITGTAIFMVSLDQLVVTITLPNIRAGLDAGLAGLAWTVNAYTLSVACLLLPAAAVGDRFGRRRVFTCGLALFTGASAAAALAPNILVLDLTRAVQGAGAAIVTPLTLSLLSAATPEHRRGLVLGISGAMSGMAIAIGPLVGGLVVHYASWQWIFWLNVPVGLLLLPAATRLAESYGPAKPLDVVGTAFASVGLFGVLFGLVSTGEASWSAPQVLVPMAAGWALLVAFVRWEHRAPAPILPMSFFRRRAFTGTVSAIALMFFGLFGTVFLLGQFLQTVQGYSPLSAGIHTLPWTATPMISAPLAGLVADRIGPRQVLVAGLAVQVVGLAGFAATAAPDMRYGVLALFYSMCGFGTGMALAPMAMLVLSAVRKEEEGIASGVSYALRQLGGVLGVAVVAAVFAAFGDLDDRQRFVAGLVPAVAVGAVVIAAGAACALLIPRHTGWVARPVSPGPTHRPAPVVAPTPARRPTRAAPASGAHARPPRHATGLRAR